MNWQLNVHNWKEPINEKNWEEHESVNSNAMIQLADNIKDVKKDCTIYGCVDNSLNTDKNSGRSNYIIALIQCNIKDYILRLQYCE